MDSAKRGIHRLYEIVTSKEFLAELIALFLKRRRKWFEEYETEFDDADILDQLAQRELDLEALAQQGLDTCK